MLKQSYLACLALILAGSIGLFAQQPEDNINVLVTAPLEVAGQHDRLQLPDLGSEAKKKESPTASIPSSASLPAPASDHNVSQAVPMALVPLAGSDNSEWIMVGGASFYLLKPFFQSNTAYTVSTGSTTDTTTLGQSLNTSFDWNYNPAAAFWLGFNSPSGLGIRSRFFFFDQSSNSAAISETGAQASLGQVISPSPFTPTNFPNIGAPVPGRFNFGSPGFLLTGPGVPPAPIGVDNLVFTSSLKIDALDVEATFAWQSDRWSFLGGAGGRYFYMAQAYHGVLTNNGGGTGDSEIQTLDFFRRFSGGGPTVSGQASRRLGQTGLALFGSARGSLLVGKINQSVSFTQTVNDPAGIVGPPGSFTLASRILNTTDNVLPVVELELGLEYAVTLLNNDWFFRATVVDQTYFDAGNASRNDGNLSLFGCQLGVGLNF